MVRQVLLASGERFERLDAAGVFPRGALSPKGGGARTLPCAVSLEQLDERLAHGDESWAARNFLCDEGYLQVVWLAFVDEVGGEHRALHALRSKRRRLDQLLGTALGVRAQELRHLVVLVDEDPDGAEDMEARLARRVNRAWQELHMRGPLLYMGPRLNVVGEELLRARDAWPLAVSNLLLAVHAEGNQQPWMDRRGVFAWRAIAWRPWSREKTGRLISDFARQLREYSDPVTDLGADVRGRQRGEDELRAQLGATHSVDVGTPTAPKETLLDPPSQLEKLRAERILQRFDEYDPTSEFASALRSRRQVAVAAEGVSRWSLWFKAWEVAERGPTASRRAGQVLDEVVDSADVGHEETAAAFEELAVAEGELREARRELLGCGEDIELAERARIGPQARLIVAASVLGLMTFAIWGIFEEVAALTGFAIKLLTASVLGCALAAGLTVVLERRSLVVAIRSFYYEGLRPLYEGRRSQVSARGRLLVDASERRIRDRLLGARRELRSRLARLTRFVDRNSFLGEEQLEAPEDQRASIPASVEQFFAPCLLEEPPRPPLGLDGAAEETGVREVFEYAHERWMGFVDEADPRRVGCIALGPLGEVLQEVSETLAAKVLSRRMEDIEDQLGEELMDSARQNALSPFLGGLSMRLEGTSLRPHRWTTLGALGEAGWRVAPSGSLAPLGFLGLQLDIFPVDSVISSRKEAAL